MNYIAGRRITIRMIVNKKDIIRKIGEIVSEVPLYIGSSNLESKMSRFTER